MGCITSNKQLQRTNSESISILDDNHNDWIKLTPFKPTIVFIIPEGVNPVYIDHNTFIMGIKYVKKEDIVNKTSLYSSYIPYIYVYSVDKNNCKQLIKYPKPLTTSHCLITFNAQENTLYLVHNGTVRQFAKLNLSTKKWKIYPFSDGIFKGRMRSIVINNEYHAMDSWKHLKWDDKQKKFVEGSFKIPSRNISNDNFEIVFLKSQQILFLFNSFSMYMQIHEYNLQTKIWKRTDFKMEHIYSTFQMVLTEDEKYIIIFDGGYVVTNKDKCLLIFDIEKYRFYNSSIKHPIDGASTLDETASPVIVNNIPYRSLLINGYLHASNVNLPNDIVYIIMSMHSKQHYCIHALNQQGTHWQVSVGDVLSNLEPNFAVLTK